MTPEELMQAAIDKAREGLAERQSPFGCAIALDGVLLACTYNNVIAVPDSTAHAEINAIRKACRDLGQHCLEGAIVASTCEPCPMCMSAMHWARVADVYYGASIADAAAAGFNELHLSAREVVQQGGSPIRLHAGLLDDGCRELFDEWLDDDRRTVY